MAGGLDSPVHVPTPLPAHTRAYTHAPAHHVRTCALRALCARQLDTFGDIGESEFVAAVIALQRFKAL